MTSLSTYIINLDRNPDRWSHIKNVFEGNFFSLQRIVAFDGRELTLPSPSFDENRFKRFHGRVLNIYELACYLSHLKAIDAFLATEEEYALFGEDDIFPRSPLEEIIRAALEEKKYWNILRLTALCQNQPLPLKKITRNATLSLYLGRVKGAGAYLLDRKAAKAFKRYLLPMWLPWDHAFDREWIYGLRALALTPFPLSQTEEYFPSTIQGNSQSKLSTWQRWWSTYPYQAFNEMNRFIYRLGAFLSYKGSRLLPKK